MDVSFSIFVWEGRSEVSTSTFPKGAFFLIGTKNGLRILYIVSAFVDIVDMRAKHLLILLTRMPNGINKVQHF